MARRTQQTDRDCGNIKPLVLDFGTIIHVASVVPMGAPNITVSTSHLQGPQETKNRPSGSS